MVVRGNHMGCTLHSTTSNMAMVVQWWRSTCTQPQNGGQRLISPQKSKARAFRSPAVLWVGTGCHSNLHVLVFFTCDGCYIRIVPQDGHFTCEHNILVRPSLAWPLPLYTAHSRLSAISNVQPFLFHQQKLAYLTYTWPSLQCMHQCLALWIAIEFSRIVNPCLCITLHTVAGEICEVINLLSYLLQILW